MIAHLIKGDKDNIAFYKHLLILTLPIMLQNLITTSLNMLDTMMIGKLGEIEIASVGIANQYYFLFTLFTLGVAGGCGVLVAQLWGNNDRDKIKKVLSKCIVISIVISLIFIISGIIIPEKIIELFNRDLRVVEFGSKYLKLTVISYLFTGISLVFASALRSIKNTNLPMFASLLGFIINAVLNYVLIFGNFGMPEMKVQGAAIATIIARIFECSLILFIVYFKDKVLDIKLKDITCLDKQLKKTLWTVTTPIVLNEACWGLGNITYIAIYAQMGTGEAAAMQICTSIMNLFMIFAFGLSYSSVVIIGNEIGANREDVAIESAKKIVKLSMILSLVLGIILFALAKLIVCPFNISAEAKLTTIHILYIFAIIMVVRVSNMVMIVGILRGGGDATYGALLQAITLWCIGIPLAMVATFVWHLSIQSVVAFASVEEIVKAIFIIKRYRSLQWIRNIVNDDLIQKHTEKSELEIGCNSNLEIEN